MEIISDPKVFAVQLDWDRDPMVCKPWMFGMFCVFICGELVGSTSNEVTLNSILAGLNGWKKTIGLRRDLALMAADPMTAFLSVENASYGLEHLGDRIPPEFTPIPVSDVNAFDILGVDGLESHRIYCVEDDATIRLLYARKWHPPPGVLCSARRPDRRSHQRDRTAQRLVCTVAGAASRL